MSIEKNMCHAKTILFIGAGASSCLDMPTTDDQAGILYELCDSEIVSDDKIKAKCFKGVETDIVNLLNLLDYPDNELDSITDAQSSIMASAFPEASEREAIIRTVNLRRAFDWPVLKKVSSILKSNFVPVPEENKRYPENYLQKVFDLIDVLLRENRGLAAKDPNGSVFFLSPERLKAGRELLIFLVNTMFGCAWRKLVSTSDGQRKLEPYRQFADALAELMCDEARNLEKYSLNDPRFYLFSYSVLTTNFEPIFLWLIYQAHKKMNRQSPIRIGNPGKKLQLMMDFPNTIAMRSLSDKPNPVAEDLNNDIWYPVTAAVAQRINDEKHGSDRVVRTGKYYFVHGSSNFRQCPRCGRLNLIMGDSWDENSPTLFPPGLTKPFSWGHIPRSEAEKEAHRRGEYDALECLFCGQLTHAQDNFMHMQTHFKGTSPSFIKEITDEAMASLTSVRHIVLLGYRFPPDDTIWTSNFIAMLNSSGNSKVYCSVVCGYDGSDEWKYGAELEAHLTKYDNNRADNLHGIEAIQNAMEIFGKDYVRAYTGGIPQVFHNGDKEFIRELLYPSKAPWNNVGFSEF